MSHTVEHYAEEVATEVLGAKPAAGGAGAPDWAALIDKIIAIVTKLLASCPAKANKLLDRINKPGALARGRFGALVQTMCEGCGNYMLRNSASQIGEAMQKVTATLDDGDVLSIVYQIQNDDWEVI